MPLSIASRALSVLILLLSFSAKAADVCAPMRLDKSGGPLESIPIMNQDDSALCYAYIAAQMIDAYRFSHGDNRKKFITSPLVTAIVHKKDSPNPLDLSYGIIDQAINAVREYGSCSTETFLQTTDFTDSQAIMFKAKTREAQLEKSMFFKKIKADCGGSTEKAIETIFGNIRAKDFLIKYTDALCKGNRMIVSSIPKPKVTKFDHLSGLKRQYAVTDNINFLLINSNPQPIAINYCSQVLHNRNWRGAQCTEGFHSSMIIGRRRNKAGNCEFLVRNTKGTKCDYAWDCENGQIWINADNLSWSIRETITLDAR